MSGFQPLRLSGGIGPHEGQLEVLYNATWGSVCDDFWGEPDADVACKQLGYNGSLSSTGDGSVKPNQNENVMIIRCINAI